jgi:thiol-disulfide isomerase/thioredoxin
MSGCLSLTHKNLLGICFLLLSVISFAQKPCSGYLLKGKISNAKGQWLYIKSYNYKTYNLVDSVQVKNGSVAVRLPFNEPTGLLLICKEARAIPIVNCGVNSFTWDVNKQSTFSMQDNGISRYYDEYNQRIAFPFSERMVEISRQRRALENNQAARDSLDKLRGGLQEQFMLQTKAFMWAHTNNFVSLYFLRYYYPSFPADTVRAMFARFSKDLKQFPAAKTLQDYLAQEKKQVRFNEFTYSSGKDSLAGFDYYVVDFWGSWCGPCIASIPAMKKLYQQYHPKNIQFVSIAYEHTDLARYHQAQEKHQMPWPQAYVVAQGDEKTLIDQYYISAYPTYLILDKNFNIRSRIIASQEELEETLKKL